MYSGVLKVSLNKKVPPPHMLDITIRLPPDSRERQHPHFCGAGRQDPNGRPDTYH